MRDNCGRPLVRSTIGAGTTVHLSVDRGTLWTLCGRRAGPPAPDNDTAPNCKTCLSQVAPESPLSGRTVDPNGLAAALDMGARHALNRTQTERILAAYLDAAAGD